MIAPHQRGDWRDSSGLLRCLATAVRSSTNAVPQAKSCGASLSSILQPTRPLYGAACAACTSSSPLLGVALCSGHLNHCVANLYHDEAIARSCCARSSPCIHHPHANKICASNSSSSCFVARKKKKVLVGTTHCRGTVNTRGGVGRSPRSTGLIFRSVFFHFLSILF